MKPKQSQQGDWAVGINNKNIIAKMIFILILFKIIHN